MEGGAELMSYLFVGEPGERWLCEFCRDQGLEECAPDCRRLQAAKTAQYYMEREAAEVAEELHKDPTVGGRIPAKNDGGAEQGEGDESP